MNKRISHYLLAASALLLGPMTQAATVNLYGIGHVSLDQVDDGVDSNTQTASSSSRLGLSAEHPLENRMMVILQIETGVDLTSQGTNDGNGPTDDGDAGQLFTKGRPSFLGIRTHWGTALIGHTPGIDQWANDYNLFADQIGDAGIFWEVGGLEGRLDNVFQYQTPNLDGFKASITHSPKENRAASSADKTYFKGDYARGDFKLGLGLASVASNTDTVAVTASYDLNRFTLGGGVQLVSNASDVDGGNDYDSFSIGASYNVSSHGKIKSHFVSISGELDNSGATLFALGYDHQLSDKTTIYIAYATVDNDTGASFSVNGKGHGDAVTPATGDDPYAFSIGLTSSFDVGLMP